MSFARRDANVSEKRTLEKSSSETHGELPICHGEIACSNNFCTYNWCYCKIMKRKELSCKINNQAQNIKREEQWSALVDNTRIGGHIIMENQKKVLVISWDEGFQGSMASIEQVASSLNLVIVNRVASYEQAMESIQRVMPDLVVCETSLGQEMDGIELMRVIYKIYPIPVFFILSEYQSNLVERTKEFATTGMMLKPLNLVQLKLNLKLAFSKIGLFT